MKVIFVVIILFIFNKLIAASKIKKSTGYTLDKFMSKNKGRSLGLRQAAQLEYISLKDKEQA